jgi:hypothetical protein
VQEQKDNHERRAPLVHGSDKLPVSRVLCDESHRLVRGCRLGTVVHGQQQAGDRLQANNNPTMPPQHHHQRFAEWGSGSSAFSYRLLMSMGNALCVENPLVTGALELPGCRPVIDRAAEVSAHGPDGYEGTIGPAYEQDLAPLKIFDLQRPARGDLRFQADKERRRLAPAHGIEEPASDEGGHTRQQGQTQGGKGAEEMPPINSIIPILLVGIHSNLIGIVHGTSSE